MPRCLYLSQTNAEQEKQAGMASIDAGLGIDAAVPMCLRGFDETDLFDSSDNGEAAGGTRFSLHGQGFEGVDVRGERIENNG